MKNIDFEFIYAEKTHDSSHKIIKRVGEFYVTLICSLGLRNYRMILVVKASKKESGPLGGPPFFHRVFDFSPWEVNYLLKPLSFILIDEKKTCPSGPYSLALSYSKISANQDENHPFLMRL